MRKIMSAAVAVMSTVTAAAVAQVMVITTMMKSMSAAAVVMVITTMMKSTSAAAVVMATVTAAAVANTTKI